MATVAPPLAGGGLLLHLRCCAGREVDEENLMATHRSVHFMRQVSPR